MNYENAMGVTVNLKVTGKHDINIGEFIDKIIEWADKNEYELMGTYGPYEFKRIKEEV